MKNQSSNTKMITKLMFRLLPVQALLVAVGSVDDLVSSYFASNFVGVEAMSAVGLFSPLNMLFSAISMMLVGGSAILCGKYMGQNEPEKTRNVFSLNIIVSMAAALFFTVLLAILGLFDLTGFLTKDETVRPLFNRYLIGQAVGLVPLIVGNQLPSYLTMENKGARTTVASVTYIIVNVILNYVFVNVLHWDTLGLGLASSLGMWVFFAVEAQAFFTDDTRFHLTVKSLNWRESGTILSIGFPGAATNAYQTVRGLIVNYLLMAFVGSVGISAMATADTFLRIFWAIPFGMLAVSRLLMSVSIGEEDRQSLTDVMRVMFTRYLPLMSAIAACIIVCAVPITRLFYRDPQQPVYMMTVWGLRILPLSMPLSTILLHFVGYGQASGKQGFVHVLSLVDGVVCVAGFTALLIRSVGMNSVYIANVLNGVVTTLIIIGYACLRKKRFPKNMDDLMVVPEDFGAPEDKRMDLTVQNTEDVVKISSRVQEFCWRQGVDSRRSMLAALSLEEMAGNVVDHGFVKDNKKHTVDVRVVMKDDDVILRIKDDCVPFDPAQRQTADEGDVLKNIGIRMVFKMAKQIQYQNILGLNVLTIRI